ncbi:MAG TPA: TonB-dependent receptor, partial [Polyangiaceae bacterium]|nr:TonB-dependent receptor [Polyangiaceae bacterium]
MLALFTLGAIGTAHGQAAATSTAPAPSPPVAPDLVPPHLLESGTVPYPEGATGNVVVTLTLVVNRDGTVRSAEVTHGDEPFASVAVAAARDFRFTPATRGGQPVAATIRFEVEFVAPAPNAEATTPNGSANAPNGAPAANSASSAAPAPPPLKAVTEVVVTGERPAPAVISLGRAEVRQLPGAFGDPFRAIEAMPGVTPIISGLPFFYVRGAPPGNVGYYLDGVRVPYLFHVGLGPSIVNPALVDRVDLYPGGYPARFGRYAGGIVSGETTAPRTDFHGEGNVRLFDLGGVLETGFAGGRGTILLGGRYSYTAAALSLVSPDAALDYRDYQARVSFDITPHDRVTAFAFGSYDLLGEKQPQGLRVLFGTEFYRLDTRYDHFYGDDNRVRFAFTLGYDRTRLDVDRNAQDKMLGARVEVTHHLSSKMLLRTGIDGTLDAYKTDRPTYVDPDDPNEALLASLFSSRSDYAFGVYGDVVWDVAPGLEVTPGLRADLFQSSGTTKPSFDARLAGKVSVTPRLKLIEAFGLAHQPPAFLGPVPALVPATLANGLQTSFQSSAGVELTLPASITATTTLFHNAFFNMSDDLGTSRNIDPSNLDQRSLGQAYGFEFYARRPLTSKLAGFVTYTLSRSVRSLGNEHFLSAFDRTHVGNVALAYDLGRNWRAGARFMFYSGVPKRPDIPPGLIQPERTTSVEREPGFYRIDLRVEKRWNFKRTGWLSLVFEMLNATFHKETVANTEIGPVTIPSIGVEAG